MFLELSNEQAVVEGGFAYSLQQRSDTRDLIRGMNGCGQLGVKIESVPVHFRQAQNLFSKLLEVRPSGMATNCQRRGNPAVCTENFIRVDDAPESPKLAE